MDYIPGMIPGLLHVDVNDFQLVQLGNRDICMFINNQGFSIDAFLLISNNDGHYYSWEFGYRIELPALPRQKFGKKLGVWELDNEMIPIVLEGIVIVHDGKVASFGQGPDLSAYRGFERRYLCPGYKPSLASLGECAGSQKMDIFRNLNQELLPPPTIQLPPKPSSV